MNYKNTIYWFIYSYVQIKLFLNIFLIYVIYNGNMISKAFGYFSGIRMQLNLRFIH